MITPEIHCIILGGGGHAGVLIDSLQQANHPARLMAILDANQSRWGQSLLGVPILGGDDLLPELINQGANAFIVGLGSVGNNQPRRRLFELGLSYNLSPQLVQHPKAILSPAAKIGLGVQLLPGCIITSGALLGDNVIINSGAIVEHDCQIGDHVHIATGARLASTVTIGVSAHIGAGATIRQCIRIGEGAVVGAGAVVVKDVEPYTVVTGVPARFMKMMPIGN